jgi:ATP-dependent Clp protease ATP-binding subunit ClpC
MDTRYSKTAKAAMFSARLEAINAGSQHVEPEHLLLGLLRRSSQIIQTHVEAATSLETLKRELESSVTVKPSLATYAQVPFSSSSSHILSVAAEEAQRHSHETVGTEHILLAILREEECSASRVLRARGMQPFAPSEDQQAFEAS